MSRRDALNRVRPTPATLAISRAVQCVVSPGGSQSVRATTRSAPSNGRQGVPGGRASARQRSCGPPRPASFPLPCHWPSPARSGREKHAFTGCCGHQRSTAVAYDQLGSDGHNAGAHPLIAQRRAARNPNPDPFVPINPTSAEGQQKPSSRLKAG